MNIRNNQRYQENERKLRECFISLLDTSDIDHITVRMLCDRTGLHRSTFYTHYEDIFDLLYRTEAAMNAELYSKVKDMMQEEDFYLNPSFYICFLKHMEKHRAFYHACLKKRNAFPIQEGAQTLFENIIRPACRKKGIFNEEEMMYYFTFYQAGITMIYKRWIDGGCREPAEKIADYIVHCFLPSSTGL